MGTYDQHPGKGQIEVRGYEPPAGTIADKARREREYLEKQQRESYNRSVREAMNAKTYIPKVEPSFARSPTPSPSTAKNKSKRSTKIHNAGSASEPSAIKVLCIWVAVLGAAGVAIAKLGPTTEGWVVAGIAAVVSGLIMSKIYKFVIGVSIVVAVAWVAILYFN
ncbi:MAG: hypothetical protein ACIAQ0_13840 [Phycisphaerales bacterium JB058]